ncbi:GNAT family N-acetyltransferase [Streptomyces sp. TR06-5]|uniref:GNAT family N-acetyltransferase n=1 Tax=unclassified Streptomyces TaxID=2593676 RepID=UPI00399FC049
MQVPAPLPAFEADPSVDRALRDDLLRLWVDVADAGGSVGFVPPVGEDDVRPELLRYLRDMADGRARLVVGRDGDGRAAASAFLVRDAHRLMRHWAWLYIVMVHPSLQGKGLGRALMSAVAETARAWDGIEALRLTHRSGRGLEHFYGACGYREVGRVPGAFRVAEEQYCDEVTQWLTLTPPVRKETTP